MSTAATCLMTFVSGAAVEAVCTKWVAAVAKGQALMAGILSMVWAVSLLLGIGEALQHGLPALTWILGYGVGSYFAVKTTSASPPS